MPKQHVWFVHPADLDGDGDIDLVTSSRDDDQVAWFRNDGSGAFSGKLVISSQIDFGRSVCTADIDGDGKLDVISASEEDDKIAWYRHLDGEGTLGSQRIVTLQADGAITVKAGDIDGDGDPDLLVASRNDNTIAWYQNNFGGEQWIEHVITDQATQAHGAALADLDGDGDLDVIGSGMGSGIPDSSSVRGQDRDLGVSTGDCDVRWLQETPFDPPFARLLDLLIAREPLIPPSLRRPTAIDYFYLGNALHRYGIKIPGTSK